MKNNHKILLLIGFILSSVFVSRYMGILDYFNIRDNKIHINIDNFQNKLIRDADFQLKIISSDTIKVNLNSSNFVIRGFPDLYGKDYIVFSVNNHKKYYHLDEYKFKSYHKIKLYISIYERDNNIILDWKLKSLNKSLIGQDTIIIN